MVTTEKLQQTYERNPSVGKKRFGSEAFRLEYDPHIPERALHNDIVSYLGEYRFNVEKYSYNLVYSKGNDGQLHIRDTDQGESMIEKGRKGLKDKQAMGEPLDKYVADLIGMERLEEQLATANDGDTIVYSSPPDPEVGYTYGFMYMGHVEQQVGQDKKLHMVAVRLDEDPTLQQYNSALTLITGEKADFISPNDFIANPKLVKRHVSGTEIDFILKGTFNFHVDHAKQKIFNEVIDEMKPLVTSFIYDLKSGASASDLQIAFNVLENYAIRLKEEKEKSLGRFQEVVSIRRNTNSNVDNGKNVMPQVRLGDLVSQFGHKPPKAVGSCGSSTSSDRLGSQSIFGSIEKNLTGKNSSENEWFSCADCGWKANGPIGNSACGGCGITKEEFITKHPELAC